MIIQVSWIAVYMIVLLFPIVMILLAICERIERLK